jgi:hypothetical protein
MPKCSYAARGENCGRTDCAQCGRIASVMLRTTALLHVEGMLALAREVVRVDGSRSDDAVTVADLARAWRLGISHTDDQKILRRHSRAWAEGVTDELRETPGLDPGDYQNDRGERNAYLTGREFVRRFS